MQEAQAAGRADLAYSEETIARPGCGEEMRTMITVELTMDEAHAIEDAATELAERDELILGPIDREALRMAGKILTNAVGVEEFYQEAAELAEAA